MKSVLMMLAAYFVLNLILIVLGLGIGLLLHGIIRAVDLGTGTLIGVAVTGFSIHSFVRLMTTIESYVPRTEEADEDEFAPPSFPNPWGTGTTRRRRRRNKS